MYRIGRTSVSHGGRNKYGTLVRGETERPVFVLGAPRDFASRVKEAVMVGIAGQYRLVFV